MENNEPMTAERRAAIKARCDAATPGPWVVSSEYASGVDLGYKPDHERTWGYGCGNDFVCDLNDGEYHEYCSQDEQRANAEFIAAARQDIPDLLAEVERWQRISHRLADARVYESIGGKWKGAAHGDCCSLYRTREEAVQSWIDEAEREVGNEREERTADR